jgi:hypothetical protein
MNRRLAAACTLLCGGSAPRWAFALRPVRAIALREKMGWRALVDGRWVGGHQHCHVGGVHILSSSHGSVSGGALEDLLAARGARQHLPAAADRGQSAIHHTRTRGLSCGRGLYTTSHRLRTRGQSRVPRAPALPHRVKQGLQHGWPLGNSFKKKNSAAEQTVAMEDLQAGMPTSRAAPTQLCAAKSSSFLCTLSDDMLFSVLQHGDPRSLARLRATSSGLSLRCGAQEPRCAVAPACARTTCPPSSCRCGQSAVRARETG